MLKVSIDSSSQLVAGLHTSWPSHTVWDTAPAPVVPKAFLEVPWASLKQSFPARHHLIL